MVHDACCACLLTADEILSNGLHQLLEEVHAARFTGQQIVRLVAKAILAQQQDTLTVFARLHKQLAGASACHDASACDEQAPAMLPVAVDWSIAQPSFSHSQELLDTPHGRALCCSHGVSEGFRLLVEQPMAVTMHQGCGCRRDCFLPEHLRMACAISQQRHSNLLKFRDFMSLAFSGLKESCRWPGQMLFRFAAAAVISSLIQQQYSAATKLQQTDTDDKEALVEQSSVLFEVLCRLPANVHCVTAIQDTSSNSSSNVQLESVKLGYAFFLHASCVNHSCKPNATIKYSFHSSNNTSSWSIESTRSLLRELRIELLSTQSIFRDEEISISYGPMYPKHSLYERQRVLQQQYLFQCTCSGCDAESKAKQAQREKDGMRMHKDKGLVAAVKELCNHLERLRQELPELSASLSEALLGHREGLPGSAKLLYELQDRLQTVKTVLSQMAQEHFLGHWRYIHGQGSIPATSSSQPLWQELSGLYCMYLDMHAQLLSALGQFLDAAEHIQLAIQIMLLEGLYEERDVVIARERVKAASLYLSAGDLLTSRQLAATAYAVLDTFASSSDPDRLQAQQILHFATRTLRSPF